MKIGKKQKNTILIVEDDPASIKLVEEMLDDFKITLLASEKGEEAIDMVQKNSKINLVIMDIKLPVMDGFEATKQIKQIKPDLPVIAQTAYGHEVNKQKVNLAGCDDFIVKPIQKEDLRELLHKFLKV